MEKLTTQKGFQLIGAEVYPPTKPPKVDRILQASSAIGNHDNSLPGSSFLWVGQDHHFDRGEVRELVFYLIHWLETGRLYE